MGDTRQFEHAMLREIYEQPGALRETIAHYVEEGRLRADVFAPAGEMLRERRDVVIAASGSSRHAGLAAEIWLEDFAGLSVDVEYASEYICRSTNTKRNPAIMVISQSGQTADTLAALREAVRRGHPTLAITNVEHSTMAQEATVSLPTWAGVEKAIPATKSFTAQLLVAYLLALYVAQIRQTMPEKEILERVAAVEALPALIEMQLAAWETAVALLAKKYADAETFLYLGRGIHYAIAREGALKLKESSYVHAEGYPAGELKHGPNALVSYETPLIVLATVDANDDESALRYEKTAQLLEDMQKQGARVLAICNDGDVHIAALATDVVQVQPCGEYLLPLEEVVPLQMFAYFVAGEHGVDVDRPRNLVKAVVTE
ncbi:MAG: SIS domain-containing protein [Acidobacteriaceae bacterium]|nr:SIS domain-containing protein [Acidobacteriaceae bacterium]